MNLEGFNTLHLAFDTDYASLLAALSEFCYQNKGCRFEIKNDGDNLGVIIDAWKNEDCVGTATFWFEDFLLNETGIS